MHRMPLIRVEGKRYSVHPHLTMTPARFASAAPLEREARDEVARAAERAFGLEPDGGTTPPDRELTIEVSRKGEVTVFQWDRQSHDRLALGAPPEWRPMRFSVSDEVRQAFERQHGVLFPHVMDVLRPDDEVDLEALGGVAFKDEATGKVLWFSGRKLG